MAHGVGLALFFLLLSGTGCLDDLRKEMDGAWFGSLLLRHLFGSELALFFCMMLVLVILNITYNYIYTDNVYQSHPI